MENKTTEYKITITRKTTWREDEQEYKKIAETGNPNGGGPVYGYVKKENALKAVETDILTQTVSDLDLTAVIKAINKME